MIYLVVVYDDNKCQKIIFDGLQMDVRKLSLCCHAKTHRLACNMIQLMASFDLGVPWPEVKF